MRLDALRVELRPRSPWEAVELGTALVRVNAAAIWKPWLLLTLPVFVLVNAAAWAIGEVWLAWLAMWWLKPLFDRIPLFVVSRAVFGDTPGTRRTLDAQRNWGWRAMLSYLTWRRIGLTRALYLPIDLLEGTEPKRLRERRRVLGAAVVSVASLLTLMCVCFIMAFSLSAVALVLLLVPSELLSESARAMWALVKDQPPAWAQVTGNAVLWMATTLVEPFYIGAGFGLYLNRRTQIEAWDVEIAFRRLRARLDAGAMVLMLGIFIGGAFALPSHAQDREPPPTPRQEARKPSSRPKAAESTLPEVFGKAQIDHERFRKSVRKAYADPLLDAKRKETIWQPRVRALPKAAPELTWLVTLFGFIGEYGLWLLLGALLVLIAATAKRWWPWMRGGFVFAERPDPIVVEPALPPDALPADVVASARRLWREGRPRRALALLYRASVETMSSRANVMLVPGATEAECLRASRRMPDGDDRNAFARIVRVWQYAAYARRMPDESEFESLLGDLSKRFGWAA